MAVPSDEASSFSPSWNRMPETGAQGDPPLDRSTLVARFAGDAELFDEVAAIFLEDYPRMWGNVHEACNGRDLTALRAAAHAVKGAVSHFTNGAPYRAAAALERLAETGRVEAFDECAAVEGVLAGFVAVVAAAHLSAPPLGSSRQG